MRLVTLTACALAVLLAAGPPARGGESIKSREILGVRIGGIHGTSGLDKAFGSGSELEIYFYHGISPSAAFGISLSGHDFGRSKLPEKDLEYLGIPQTIDFMVYSLTGCLMTKADLSKKLRISGELGGGLYTSTSSIPVGVMLEGRLTYNQPGVYAGGEIWWRLSKGGIHLGLGGKWHYMWTGTDYRQPVWTYTDKDYAHFFQVTLGISFYTDD
jgi:hypothetical protein